MATLVIFRSMTFFIRTYFRGAHSKIASLQLAQLIKENQKSLSWDHLNMNAILRGK